MLRKTLTLSVAFGGFSLFRAIQSTQSPLKAETVSEDKRSTVNEALKQFKSCEWLARPFSVDLSSGEEVMSRKMELMILKAQKLFVKNLQQIENDVASASSPSQENTNEKHQFIIDRWSREKGGGGVTCVLQDGTVFEKAGVNVSVVHGNLPSAAIQQMKSRGKILTSHENEVPFFACGISSVIHPRNPHVPTLHFNYRYFEVTVVDEESKKNKTIWWFGGGCDLTPYYLSESDAVHFHSTLQQICNDYGEPDYYTRFKAWCDKYFRIEHRNTSRGVGGIFFDDLDTPDRETCFNFVSAHALAVSRLYVPLVVRNMHKAYGNREREWQLIRRGHYAEFNLVYDRGTKFGLYTPDARFESILMSLPLYAKWEYMFPIEAGSEEEKLHKVLITPKDWV